MYNKMMENFSAQLFLHLVHWLPSWIPATEDLEKYKNNGKEHIAGFVSPFPFFHFLKRK